MKEPAQEQPAPKAAEPAGERRAKTAAAGVPQRASQGRNRSRADTAVAAAVGNGAMQRYVSRRGDPEERRADAAAASALRRARPAAGTPTTGSAPPRGASRGAPLDPRLRASLETGFRADLSAVRVHADGHAAARARALDAEAFTVGRDITFGAGRYRPGDEAGRRLIAHEVAHVLQQSGHLGPHVHGVVQREETTGSDVAEVPAPGSEEAREDGPTEDAPAAPRAGAARLWFHGVAIADDAEFMRGQVRRLIARRGMRGANEWYRRLHGEAPTTVPLPFSAHARSAGGLRARTAYDAQQRMRQQREEQQLLPRIRPTVDTAYREVTRDAAAFLREFETKARKVTRGVLEDSEARVEAERIRYGLEREETSRTRRTKDAEGGMDTTVDVTVRHDMDRDTASVKGLAGAAQDLQAKRQEKAELAARRSRLVEREYYPRSGMVRSTTVPERNRAAYDRLTEQIEEKEREYQVLRHTYQQRYPILASYGEDPAALARIARGPSADVAALLNEQVRDKLTKIEKVRSELHPGGRVVVWKLPEIVALTKGATGAVEGTSLGDMRKRLVDDKVAAVQAEETWVNIALGVLVLGLAALAAIPTGGSSLLAGVAALGAIGSFGVGAAMALEHLQQYRLESAMAGSDFDRARAISAEEPSLFWLAVDILGVALDAGPALRGTRALLTSGRRTFRQLAPAVRRAIAAEGDAADQLAELRRVAGEAEHGGPSLAARVEANVRRLRGSDQTVEQLAGAAGHEARAVRRAGRALDREASRALGSAPGGGGHTVRVTPGGRVVRCSSCGILREEFAEELARNPDLARRWAEVDEAARAAASAGDTPAGRRAAERVAEQARQLADELDSARAIRQAQTRATAAVPASRRAGNWDDVYAVLGKPVDGTTLPPGYTTYQHGGRTLIRRVDATDANFQRLTVDQNGLIQIAGRTRRSTAGFLNPIFRRIAADPNHPLRFLLVSDEAAPGGLAWRTTERTTASGRVQRGRFPGNEHGPVVQVGHQGAHASGAPERLMLEDAELNVPLGGDIIESRGAFSFKSAVEIGGVPVDYATAQQWERLGLLPAGTVESSRVILPPEP